VFRFFVFILLFFFSSNNVVLRIMLYVFCWWGFCLLSVLVARFVDCCLELRIMLYGFVGGGFVCYLFWLQAPRVALRVLAITRGRVSAFIKMTVLGVLSRAIPAIKDALVRYITVSTTISSHLVSKLAAFITICPA